VTDIANEGFDSVKSVASQNLEETSCMFKITMLVPFLCANAKLPKKKKGDLPDFKGLAGRPSSIPSKLRHLG